MSTNEIQKSFKKYISIEDIRNTVSKFDRLEWFDNKTKLRCNYCLNIKPYTYEYFQITSKTKEKTCRDCRNLQRINKRTLARNI